MRRRYALGTILRYPIFDSCDLWVERSQSRTAFRSAIAAAVQHPVPVVAITQPNERMVCGCRSNSSQKCRYDRKTVRRCSERGLEAPISGPRKPRKRLIDPLIRPADRRGLKALAREGRNTPHKHVWRAEIVLLSADGVGTNEIMRRTGKSKTCVWRWQERFMEAGYDSLLHDKTRPSRIPSLGSCITERVVTLTQTAPPTEATHWTSAMMAKVVGISASSVQRIWRAHGLQPHRVKQFKLSTDPRFVDKLRDVVGLMSIRPPMPSSSRSTKSQIQALDRTQPGLPMKKGRAGTMTHDYKRHGTTTLFAALNVLDGTIIGRNMQRHRHQEFIRFLNTIEAQVPARKQIHAIVDNYATHKHPKVRQWLARHPRWTFHFTPTSASWLRRRRGPFFAKLTKQRLERGIFLSVVDLQAAINRFVIEHNAEPKPFTWTADA